MHGLRLELIPFTLGINRFPPGTGIPIFVVSTYDTDIPLVRSAGLEAAVDRLESPGHRISVCG